MSESVRIEKKQDRRHEKSPHSQRIRIGGAAGRQRTVSAGRRTTQHFQKAESGEADQKEGPRAETPLLPSRPPSHPLQEKQAPRSGCTNQCQRDDGEMNQTRKDCSHQGFGTRAVQIPPLHPRLPFEPRGSSRGAEQVSKHTLC